MNSIQPVSWKARVMSERCLGTTFIKEEHFPYIIMTRLGKPAMPLRKKPRMSRRLTPAGITSSIKKMNLSQLNKAKWQTAKNENLSDQLKRQMFAAITRREKQLKARIEGNYNTGAVSKSAGRMRN